MKRLSAQIVDFFHNQGYVLVSTLDREGKLHNSCKGIVKIEQSGKIYLLDLYQGRTYDNLKTYPNISITVVDEHKFVGYCLKGRAKIITQDKMTPELLKAWEDRLTSRLTQRVLRNIRDERGHPRHPESLLPKPKYLIVMDVLEIVDLTPHHLKHSR